MNKARQSIQPQHTDAWARLVSARDASEVRAPWLELACARIGPVEEALIYDRVGDADYRVTKVWPAAGTAQADLEQLAAEAVAERRGLVSLPQAPDGSLRGGCHLAYPVILGDFVHGAVAVALATDRQAAINDAMRNLQWSLGWLRDFLQQRVLAGGDGSGASRLALEGVADMIGPEGFEAAAQTLVTRLAARFGLERASIGFTRRGAARLVAISNSASFGRRMTLVRLTEQAMDEAIDQERAILHPAAGDEDDSIRRAHEALTRETGGGAILTVPLIRDDATVGALTCEAPAGRGFSQRDVDAVNAIAAFAGPVLMLRRELDCNILARNASALGRGLRGLFGPSHLGAKLSALAVLAAVAAVTTIQTTYEVTAEAAVEAAVQRAIVAPYDGFVMEAPLRAGDTVVEGGLVAMLDDRDKALEALYWQSERLQRQLEYDRALGERDIGQLNIVQAQLDQAEVRLQLVNAELAQARLVAPIGGIIVSGDLSQSIGGAVARGEVLFRIAPLDTYRLMLDVDEAQIGQVETGMTGTFLSSSLPGAPQRFTVSKITPVATARDGRTVFRVEAAIDSGLDDLRPGMRGVGKIDAGEASLAWVWTRAFRDWARMAAWSWLP